MSYLPKCLRYRLQILILTLNEFQIKSYSLLLQRKIKREEKSFSNECTDIQQALKIWKMRNLKLGEKTVILKTIAISKIVSQSFITTAP